MPSASARQLSLLYLSLSTGLPFVVPSSLFITLYLYRFSFSNPDSSDSLPLSLSNHDSCLISYLELDMGCFSPTGCCAPSISMLACLLLLTSMAFPWYLQANVFTKKNVEDARDYEVVRLEMIGWQDAFCVIKENHNGTAQYVPPCPHGRHYSWRNEECNGVDTDCSQTYRVYTLSAAFTGVALLASLLVTITLFRRCCSAIPTPGKNQVMIVISIFGLLSVLAATLIFALRHPVAYSALRPSICDTANAHNETSPCHSFWGFSKEKTEETDATHLFMPAGWIAAALGGLLHLIATMCVCRKVDPITSYQHAQYAQFSDLGRPIIENDPKYPVNSDYVF